MLLGLRGLDTPLHPAQKPSGEAVLPGAPPEIARRNRFVREREREEIPFQRLPEIGKIRCGKTLAGQDDLIYIVRRVFWQRGADRGESIRPRLYAQLFIPARSGRDETPAFTVSPSISICKIPFSPHSSKPRPSGQPGQA